MLGSRKQQNQNNRNDPHNPQNTVWTGRGGGDSEDNLIEEDESDEESPIDRNNVGELGDRQRDDGTGLNVIHEEDDFASCANPPETQPTEDTRQQ